MSLLIWIVIFYPLIVLRVIFVYKIFLVMAVANYLLVLCAFEFGILRAVAVVVFVRLILIDHHLV